MSGTREKAYKRKILWYSNFLQHAFFLTKMGEGGEEKYERMTRGRRGRRKNKRKRGWGRRGREWSAVLITGCDGLLKSVIRTMSSLAKLGIPT